ncbi:hypothetical protein [Clostridium weizhouense]|uniref:Uncharacterized protein n=1 Tax=Clostridium weizhouense TaxID=2859781 RepID=A0ABS7ALP7_9CLOT|nr:hypothetical protein [Clostridium weizhouense]MBW6409567.1 hypothetical protein [Clostridium weizhouense]
MLNENDDTYKDDNESLNYEFSSIPYEYFSNQRTPFIPGGKFPGGGNMPPGMPQSPPPNYIPSKKDNGVQKLSKSQDSPQAKAVSPNSIRFCLFKYTYIWETNGKSYWAFLFNVDKRSISGFRWLGRYWVYFGLDLKRIDSFICYRSDLISNCENCRNSINNDIQFQNNKQEYSLNEIRHVYTKTLASIDIPEVKEDFKNQTIGYIDDTPITTEVPCVKFRNISYRITLELSYPSNYDDDLKTKINLLANEASNNTYETIFSTRNNDESSNPLEVFNSSIGLIPEALKSFSDSFNSKFRELNLSKDRSSEISYYIREEKINDNWKYYYKDSFF